MGMVTVLVTPSGVGKGVEVEVGVREGVAVGEALGDDVALAVSVTAIRADTVCEADGVTVDVLVWDGMVLAVGSAVLVHEGEGLSVGATV